MSDDQNNGNSKIAHLISKATSRSKDAEKPTENVRQPDTDLELEVEDPTRERDTPPELTNVGDPEQEFELEEEETDKGGIFSKMSLTQRILLVGLVAAVFIGANRTLFSDDSMEYLDRGEQTASTGTATRNAEPSVTDGDGFEPIDQGGIAPDSNALNLTGNNSSADAEASNAFSLDPLNEEGATDETEPAPMEAPEDQVATTGEGTVSEEVVVTASTEVMDIDDDAFSPKTPEESTPNDANLMPPQGFDDPLPKDDPEALQEVKANIGALNSEISSLSQSVLSIKKEMTDTASTNRQLASEISRLMAALEERDKQVMDLKSRPDIRDLVIFRAASDCDACVPHAYFRWNDKEMEVGDGLQWQGYDVAIRGDRMTLRNQQNVYHYWYR